MQLTFDADVEAFRAEFVAFLDEHLPVRGRGARAAAFDSRTSRNGRGAGSGCCSTTAGCVPGNPPEFGGRNATILQQYVHQEELSRRRIYQSFNPQGVGIIAASLISFGTPSSSRSGRCRSCGRR